MIEEQLFIASLEFWPPRYAESATDEDSDVVGSFEQLGEALGQQQAWVITHIRVVHECHPEGRQLTPEWEYKIIQVGGYMQEEKIKRFGYNSPPEVSAVRLR